jgi:GDPmannose 4,6-dehydratase
MKRALITGISGQDGSYLAEYLLKLGYEVYGLVRREPQTLRWLEPIRNHIEFVYGDLRDEESLEVAFRKAWPDELYNLAAQVFVPTSWACPAETFDINVGGVARLLRIIEQQKPETRIYQASSSEMFGYMDGFCNEQTPYNPASPYGTSKAAAHHLVRVYRRSGLFAVGGILFNHESPRRGAEMVTRKITRAAGAWSRGDKTKLKLGNLEAKRDWGFAGDYVRAMHGMLQQPSPKDYVVGTGESHSVADFVAEVLSALRMLTGNRDFSELIEPYVEVDSQLLRPNEIPDMKADASLARRELQWQPTVDFRTLVKMMVESELVESDIFSVTAAR